MAIVKMKRLRLVAMGEDREPLMARLQKLGCVEIDRPADRLTDPQWSALVHADSVPLDEMRSLHGQAKAALAALDQYAPVKTGLFAARRGVTAEQLFGEDARQEAQAAAGAIGEQTAAIAALYAEKSRLSAQKESLIPWMGTGLALDCEGTESVCYHRLTAPLTASPDAMRQAVEETCTLAHLEPVSRNDEMQYLLLISHRTEEQDALDALKRFGVMRAVLRGWQGTAEENIARLEQQLAEVEAKLEQGRRAIVEQSGHREALKLFIDRLEQDLERGSAMDRLLSTETTFLLEGWVPEPQVEQLEALLKDYTCAHQLEDPGPDDDPPVKLKTRKLTWPMNMVTEMYSLPAYDGIDPNPLILPFFTLFFGIMYADLGYGLVLIALSLVLLKKGHFKGMMDQMVRLVFMCGVSTAIMGFAFGGFFGDVLTVIWRDFLGVAPEAFPAWLTWFNSGPLFNPMNDPMRMMVFALVLGAVHLITGMIVHIYMAVRDGEALDGILDVVPWWVLFAGFGVGAMGKGWTLALIGALSLVLTQGRHKKGIFGKLLGGVTSLYDVTSYLSDILSYLRLMALVLATSVIASVVNILGAMTGVVGFVVIFIIGHSFNMAVNIIGTYVHAARLQYLEFFGKFYKEGGRAFAPLKLDTNYVDIIKEEQQDGLSVQ